MMAARARDPVRPARQAEQTAFEDRFREVWFWKPGTQRRAEGHIRGGRRIARNQFAGREHGPHARSSSHNERRAQQESVAPDARHHSIFDRGVTSPRVDGDLWRGKDLLAAIGATRFASRQLRSSKFFHARNHRYPSARELLVGGVSRG